MLLICHSISFHLVHDGVAGFCLWCSDTLGWFLLDPLLTLWGTGYYFLFFSLRAHVGKRVRTGEWAQLSCLLWCWTPVPNSLSWDYVKCLGLLLGKSFLFTFLIFPYLSIAVNVLTLLKSEEKKKNQFIPLQIWGY